MSLVRCKDEHWGKHHVWGTFWCPHSKQLRYDDIPKDELYRYWYDWRCVNWLRICTKSKKVVVHNKKCDIEEVIKI